jgi:NADH-quinone oxidoreductase subunit C
MNETERLIDDLSRLTAAVNLVNYRQRGYHQEVRLQPDQVRAFAELLRQRKFYLVFVSAVDVSPAIEIIYQFACFARPCRILARSTVAADGTLPSIADIFHGANWHERETRDMFGVVFTGHPGLEPLLLPEEAADLKPLLKEEGALKPTDQVRPLPAEEATPSDPPATTEQDAERSAKEPKGEDRQ